MNETVIKSNESEIEREEGGGRRRIIARISLVYRLTFGELVLNMGTLKRGHEEKTTVTQ